MQPLTLNFSKPQTSVLQWFWRIAFFVLLLGLISLFSQHDKIMQHTLAIASNQIHPPVATKKNARMTENEKQMQSMATRTLRALNTPWEGLLHALEQVQSAHQDIDLFSIQPNPSKNEVTIIGTAKDFASMMAYVEALKKQSIIQEVNLVNQAWAKTGSQKQLEFTLNTGWQF